MSKTLNLLLVAFCLTATAQNSATSAPQSEIYITHVTVIDTETGKEATDQTVVISDGKIADVAKTKNLAAPASARIVDGRGKYLIPGLRDMHGTDVDSTLPLYIANGVTGVREMLGPADANKFRADLPARHLIAPHIYLGSPIVEQETSGKKRVYSEVRDIAPDSFTQILQESDTGGPLKETAIISAKRISQPSISSGSHDDDLRERQESLTKANAEIQKLSDLLLGRWSGILTTEAASHERGRADETWRLSPGGLTLVEENRLSTPNGDSFDYAAVWWNPKAQKYQGIWCADINDEGCNGFDATLKGEQVEMTGEWEQKGHRRAWREVFSRPDADSSIQTLDIGEPGGELKRVSAIRATKITEGSTELSKAPADGVKGCKPKSKLKPQTGSQISPSPEMQKILATQLGTWSQHEERPDGTTGDGEAT